MLPSVLANVTWTSLVPNMANVPRLSPSAPEVAVSVLEGTFVTEAGVSPRTAIYRVNAPQTKTAKCGILNVINTVPDANVCMATPNICKVAEKLATCTASVFRIAPATNPTSPATKRINVANVGKVSLKMALDANAIQTADLAVFVLPSLPQDTPQAII